MDEWCPGMGGIAYEVFVRNQSLLFSLGFHSRKIYQGIFLTSLEEFYQVSYKYSSYLIDGIKRYSYLTTDFTPYHFYVIFVQLKYKKSQKSPCEFTLSTYSQNLKRYF